MFIEPTYFLVLLFLWSATFGAGLYHAVTRFLQSRHRKRVEQRLSLFRKKPTIKKSRRVKQ